MKDLVLVDELKGLEKSKADQIEKVFAPMVKMLKEFEAAYNDVTTTDINVETCKTAKRLRLDIAKIRISADKARAEQKAEYLRAGNAIQGVYNILKYAITDKEENLKKIETHYEREEAEKTRIRQEERQEELYKYNPEHPFIDLGSMSDEVWENFLAGTKAGYEAKIQAEQKAESDRLAAIEAERIENERIRVENEKLRKEAEEREKKILAENKKKEKALEKERAENAAKEENARLEAEAIQKRQDEQIRKERAARQKAEAEAAIIEQERKDRIKAEKKAANAPDKEKLEIISNNLLEKLDMFVSEEAKKAMKQAAQIIKSAAKEL